MLQVARAALHGDRMAAAIERPEVRALAAQAGVRLLSLERLVSWLAHRNDQMCSVS
jgi:hypothetical protein